MTSSASGTPHGEHPEHPVDGSGATAQRLEPPFYGTGPILIWGDEDSPPSGASQPACRGCYAFFPSITDGNRLILLDPGDFCTELLELPFPQQDGGWSLASLFRPEGDSVAFAAVTPGWGGEPGSAVPALRSCLREVRRALCLDTATGSALCWGHQLLPHHSYLPVLFELLSLEERLGLAYGKDGVLTPAGAQFVLFVQHPAVRTVEGTLST